MAIKQDEQKNKLVSAAKSTSGTAMNNTQQRQTAASTLPTTGTAQKTTQTASAATTAAPPEPTTDYSKYRYDAATNDAYMQAISALQTAQKEMPSYAGTYDTQLHDLYNQIVNRDKFKFNLNEDMLYQQYRDQYTQQGAMAMRDTMGQAAALTGGYGSTYAEAVGQQQYNAYLQQLNDVVPELYGMALDRYNAEGDRLMEQYGMLGDMADKEYGRYQDALNQYWQNLSYLQGRADTEYDRGYNDWYNAYQMGTEQDQIAYQKYLDQRNYDYQLGRDAVDDDWRERQFAYQKEQDTYDREFAQQQFDYVKEQDALDRTFAAEQFAYQKEQDKYQQGVDAERFAYEKEQDAYDREQQAGMTAYEKQLNNHGTLVDLITKTGYTPTDAELQAVGMTRAQADAYRSQYVPTGTKSSSSNGSSVGSLGDGSGDSTSKDNENPETDKGSDGNKNADLSKLTYPKVKDALEHEGEDTKDLVDAYTWNAQKRNAMQNGGQHSSEITKFNSYEEYLRYYLNKKGYGD